MGHCVDNGLTEDFLKIVKSEMYYTWTFTGAASLRKAISDYVDFYSNESGDKPPAKIQAEALDLDNPMQCPIAPNKRIEKYKDQFAAKNSCHPHMRTATACNIFVCFIGLPDWDVFIFARGYRFTAIQSSGLLS